MQYTLSGSVCVLKKDVPRAGTHVQVHSGTGCGTVILVGPHNWAVTVTSEIFECENFVVNFFFVCVLVLRGKGVVVE